MSGQNINLAAINLRNVLDDATIQTIDSLLPPLKDGLESYKNIQKALALINDGIAFVNLALNGFALLSGIARQLADIVLNLLDTSFHMLELSPQIGGLRPYVNRFQAKLDDKADENRPIDNGGAFYFTIMMTVSSKDQTDAINKIQSLVGLFTQADSLRRKKLTDLLGITNFDKLKEDFWNHYDTKYANGSHQRIEGGWYKRTISELFPENFQEFYETIQNLVDYVPGDLSRFNMSNRIDEIFNFLVSIIEDVISILDSWKKLLLDSQITLMILPPVAGSASNNIPFVASANSNLRIYCGSISKQVEDKKYNDLTPDQIQGNYDAMLNYDVYVAGINLVFKSASPDAAIEQGNAFLKLFGLGGGTDWQLVDNPDEYINTIR